ncbi:MAG TPA: hypothetical protein VEA15_04425 [Caulobacteraceae bacterium]|nr:hypothetical protein [Caulobacteraceae bacterium]
MTLSQDTAAAPDTALFRAGEFPVSNSLLIPESLVKTVLEFTPSCYRLQAVRIPAAGAPPNPFGHTRLAAKPLRA